MGKLQYDSFYKFMVSAGVILVAAPIVGLYYLLCNGNQILLSQNEYDELSYSSLQFVHQRDQTILCVLTILPYLLGGLIVLGFICLIYGSLKWHSIQKEIDEQTKLKTREQKINVEKLSATEIAEKIIDEATEEHENQPLSGATPTIKKSFVAKALEIENLCYSYIFKLYYRSYDVQQNVKVEKSAYDVLAISKFDNIDYLFEVKYWANNLDKSLFYRVAERMESMKIEYESISQRKCKCVLMIVTANEAKERIQSSLDRFISNKSVTFDVRVYTENELK